MVPEGRLSHEGLKRTTVYGIVVHVSAVPEGRLSHEGLKQISQIIGRIFMPVPEGLLSHEGLKLFQRESRRVFPLFVQERRISHGGVKLNGCSRAGTRRIG